MATSRIWLLGILMVTVAVSFLGQRSSKPDDGYLHEMLAGWLLVDRRQAERLDRMNRQVNVFFELREQLVEEMAEGRMGLREATDLALAHLTVHYPEFLEAFDLVDPRQNGVPLQDRLATYLLRQYVSIHDPLFDSRLLELLDEWEAVDKASVPL